MKNDLPARAMSHIDDALIEEASFEKVQVSRTAFTRKMLIRFGSLAACAVIAVGIFFMSRMNGSQVLLCGEALTEDQPIAVNAPRTIAYELDVTQQMNIVLDLEFKGNTSLRAENAQMTVLNENGEQLFSGIQYTAKGAVLIKLEAMQSECSIVTDRGYDIVLKLDGQSQLWTITKVSQK